MSQYFQNCTIVDGTGATPYQSGLWIKEGRIAQITDIPPVEDGIEIIDCTGLTAMPGFIDAHSHNDFFALSQDDETYFRPFIQQGITTFVVGNCGFSASGYPASSPYVDEIGGSIFSLDEESRRYPDFSQWIQAVDHHALCNLAPLIGHGTARIGVNGQSAKPLSTKDHDSMLTILEDALKNGAPGISLGLMYEPGIFAPKEELLEVARLVKKYDRVLTVHPKAESTVSLSYPIWAGSHLLLALRDLADIVRETGVKLQYSHLIFVGRRTWKDERAALSIFETLRAEGYDVQFDMYPLNYGASVISVVLPEWYMRLSREKRLAPFTRLKLRIMVKVTTALLGFGFSDITIAYAGPEHQDWIGKTICQLAEIWGISPFSAYLRACEETQFGASVLQGGYQNLDIMRRLMRHPLSLYMTDAWVTREGKQNGGIYGAFPMFVEQALLSDYPLEEAVAKMTGLTAHRFGLKDRGVLRTGAHADLVLVDLPALKSRIPEELPPLGVCHVLVGGTPVLWNGQYKGMRGAGSIVLTDTGTQDAV